MLLKDAIRTVGAKLAKAERRLAAMPTDTNRKLARAFLAITLEALVAQAQAGKVYEYTDRVQRPAGTGNPKLIREERRIRGDWRNASPHVYSVE